LSCYPFGHFLGFFDFPEPQVEILRDLRFLDLGFEKVEILLGFGDED